MMRDFSDVKNLEMLSIALNDVMSKPQYEIIQDYLVATALQSRYAQIVVDQRSGRQKTVVYDPQYQSILEGQAALATQLLTWAGVLSSQTTLKE